MSAIFGLLHLNRKSVEQEVLQRMRAILAHRGSDSSGLWKSGTIGLGHQMQWTTPESCYEQLPWHNKEGNLVITADARLDNREELIDALDLHYTERENIPDSLLILRAYQKWGKHCLNHLLGAFAFAIWDVRCNYLFCARDHIGFRPLYYYYDSRLFAFATEIKGILTVPDVSRKLNEVAVADYLASHRRDKEITFYEKIFRLPPGHFLIVWEGGFQKQRYWMPELLPELRLASDAEYAEAFRERLFQAIHSCLRSAYPVGVMLSGGLDSSSIACVAASQLRKKGKSLVAVSSALPKGYTGKEQDERKYIKAVTAWADIQVDYVLAEGITPFDNLEHRFWHLDQPCRDSFHYMEDALYKAARERGVRVLLSGFGGDRFASFSGEGYLGQLLHQGRWPALAQSLQQQSVVREISYWQLLRKEVLKYLRQTFLYRLHRRWRSRGSNHLLPYSVIHPVFARYIELKDLKQCQETVSRLEPQDKVNAKLLSNLNFGTALEYKANSSSAYRLECRFPLLDKRIVEFCLAVPAAQYVCNGWERSLMRRSMEGILPPEVQWRTTKGAFTPDFHRRVLSAKPQVFRFLSEIETTNHIWQYIDRIKLEHLLDKVEPKTVDDWEVYTQKNLVPGIMLASFLRWFEHG